MTVAQGINKTVSYKIQTALGSPASGSGGQKLRRRTCTFEAAVDTFESDEIVSHQQSTGATIGMKKTSGKLSGLLSPDAYSDLIGSALRSEFAAVTPYNAGIDVAASATAPHFVDTSGGFLTAGLKVGDVVRWTGWDTDGAANNSKNFLITALTATDMTGVFLNGDAVVADAGGASDDVTVTVVGKKSKVPLTGHTNDYYTFEDWYDDLGRSELFADVQVGQIALGLPATGNATIDIDFIGRAERVSAAAQVLTTPTAETTGNVLTAVNGVVYVNGSAVSSLTGATITINPNLTAGEATVGSKISSDIQRGRIAVSGQFTGLYDAATISALYDAETKISLVMVVTDNDTATSPFVAVTLGRILLTGDAPDDGEKQIVRTYPFTAEINSAGGAALTWDQTIITVQDSAA